MSKSLFALSFATLLATMSALATSAGAVTQFWDVNGSAAGFGGIGAWDVGATSNWNDASGTGPPQTWANGNDATFQGTGGTVTFTGGVTAGAMTMLGTSGAGAFTF